MDNLDFTPTTKGTPQGGVLSPLLANIALHGLENAIRTAIPNKRTGMTGRRPIVVRYADDFVILHEDRGIIERLQHRATMWLRGMGLELKPSKTRITHSLNRTEEGNVGFDFLGWTFRQYPAGKYRTGKDTLGRPLGFKTIITPSKEAQKRHQTALAHMIVRQRSAKQATLISSLNRLICGWVNYHATSVAKRAFARMNHLLFCKLYYWAKRRHPKKPGQWVTEKYWRPDSGGIGDFHVKDGPHLYRHQDKAIVRHVKVAGVKSPFDGDWVYWAQRLGRHPELSTEVAILLRKQKGRCAWCRLLFTNDDIKERDHIIPGRRKLKVGWSEKQLLHGHCHDRKTAVDGSTARGATDKDDAHSVTSPDT
jgi:RNA-directed DNA polymerase